MNTQLKKIAESSEAWGLKNADGWVVVADDAGREMIPLWPHSRYAEACAIDTWSDCKPISIDVHKILDELDPWISRTWS